MHAATVGGGFVVGDAGTARHLEAAVFANTHAAAVGGGVGIIRIRAADGAAGHLEGAAAADYIHAAAVFGGIIAGDGGDVLAVGGRGHGEATFAGHIHAAASVGFVAGDAAAGHLEVGLRIYAAAAIGGRVGLTRFRAADGAAGHGESAAVHIHAAAIAVGGVAGNAAAVHIE